MVATVTNKHIWHPEALTLKRMMAFVMIFVNLLHLFLHYLFSKLLIVTNYSLPAVHLCSGLVLTQAPTSSLLWSVSVCGSDLSHSLQRFMGNHGQAKGDQSSAV